jgi:hypothetical protein
MICMALVWSLQKEVVASKSKWRLAMYSRLETARDYIFNVMLSAPSNGIVLSIIGDYEPPKCFLQITPASQI